LRLSIRATTATSAEPPQCQQPPGAMGSNGVTGEAAIATPGSAGVGAAWWHHSLRMARTYPAVLFCRSSPIWLQELPADADTLVSIAFLLVFFF